MFLARHETFSVGVSIVSLHYLGLKNMMPGNINAAVSPRLEFSCADHLHADFLCTICEKISAIDSQ